VQEKIESKLFFSVSSNSLFELQPNQKVTFETKQLNLEALKTIFHNVLNDNSYESLPTELDYFCDYMVTVELLGLVPLSIGKFSEYGTFFLSEKYQKQQRMSFVYHKEKPGVVSAKKTKSAKNEMSFLSNVHFKQNSMDYFSTVPSVAQFLPESIEEFVVSTPLLCQNIQFHSDSFNDGWRICLTEQRMNLVDEHNALHFILSGFRANQHQSLAPLLFTPIGNSIMEISSGSNLTITSFPSCTNILNSLVGIRNSSSFSFLKQIRTVEKTRFRTLTATNYQSDYCASLENSFLGLRFSSELCTVGNQTTFSFETMERNSVNHFFLFSCPLFSISYLLGYCATGI
jgi:hypothetical protein